MRIYFFLFIITCLSISCEDRVATPKPRAYPRVLYPEEGYKTFDASYCNFTFDMPVYANIERDTSFFGKKPESDCWFNLDVPVLSAKIHCSYNPVKNRAGFDKLVQDAFEMTNKHNIKANYIEEITVSRPEARVHGIIFNIEGPAASGCQFFLTDSTRHFLRGALYFNARTRPDSLAPVLTFMKKDVERLIETLRWK
jgi:gliding motility-associated lipoprotein GldD